MVPPQRPSRKSDVPQYGRTLRQPRRISPKRKIIQTPPGPRQLAILQLIKRDQEEGKADGVLAMRTWKQARKPRQDGRTEYMLMIPGLLMRYLRTVHRTTISKEVMMKADGSIVAIISSFGARPIVMGPVLLNAQDAQ